MELSRKFSKRRYFKSTIVYFLTCCMLFNTSLSVALAGPEGAQVVNGQVSFQQSGYNTTITASDKSIINYSSFDIARPEIVEFIQPGSSASVLNRILSANPTNINGTLLANGRVFFVNPAGVYFGAGARVNVNQLVASGLNITNSDFINGQYNFAGGNGSVINSGDISAEKVYLIGRQVANSGSISCPAGYVVMASGDRVFLGEPGTDVVLEVDAPSLPESAETIEGSGVLNEGTVNAAGGTIVLAAGDIYSQAISNTGSLSASVETGEAGQITLTADGGQVTNTGTIEASGSKGGQVAMEGARVGQFGTVHADGIVSDGGNVDLLASDVVALSSDSLTTANAGTNGDGGEIIIWADGITRFYGNIEARGGTESGDGGFAEVSGQNLLYAGHSDLSAPQGEVGTLLLDPETVTIADTGAEDTELDDGQILSTDVLGSDDWTISDEKVESELDSADVLIQASTSITVDHPVDASSNTNAYDLTLGAPTINLKDSITLMPGASLLGEAGNATTNVSENGLIGNAIDVTAANGTVNVADGTYTEDLTVDKSNLTLQSVNGRGLTTIQLVDGVGIDIGGGATGFTLGGGSSNGFTILGDSDDTTFDIQLTNGPSGVEISWNTINTTGNATMGISVGTAGASGLNINNNIFTADGTGLTADGSIWGPLVSNAIVSDNTFSSSSGEGYAIQFSGLTNSTISRNEIAGYGSGISVFHGEGVSDVFIEENEITGCTNGIRFGEYKATGGPDGNITNVTVRNNTVTGGTNGIRLNPDGLNVSASGITVYENDFSGNTYGVKNEFTSGTLDASRNWWGSADGPKIGSNTYNVLSQGVEIYEASADTVTYVRWLDSGGDDGDPDNGFQPTGSLFAPVTNITQSTYHSSIGSGITLATTADILQIADGTFSEAVTVDRNLTLTVPSDTATMTSLSSDGSTTTGLSGLFAADSFQFVGGVTLAGHASLSTGTGTGNIDFQSTLDGSTDFAENLTLTAGIGNIDFGGVVGGTALGDVIINSAQNVTADAAFTAKSLEQQAGTGKTWFKSTITTKGATATKGDKVDITTDGDIEIVGKVDATGGAAASPGQNGGNVTLSGDKVTVDEIDTSGTNASGPGDEAGGAGGNIQITSTTKTTLNDNLTAAGGSGFGAGSDGAGGNITLNGPTEYTVPIAVSTGTTTGNISFTGTLDNDNAFEDSLGLTSGTGNIDFDSAVGNNTQLGAVTINSAQNVTVDNVFKAASLVQTTGTGTTTLKGDVTTTAAAGLDISNNAIVLDGLNVVTTNS
ncbi:MAG TPA: filamentous hemagglutinin N-terminal domain-containing protein, partial [Sedimentisphaerales bacterium]|nr:filamentous hemagglutinin N-terminal domain-containing protein [Sedimentisphaerales bacterium]